MKYRIATLAALAAAVTTLSACGSSSQPSSTTQPSSAAPSSTSSAAATHNAADVTFATDMIPHHSQAIVMADMALSKATNADVKTLAAQIKAAQDPEITTMTGWLKAWGKPVPSASTSTSTSMTGMNGMDDTSSSMGMMSDSDMATLDKTSGVSFDRMWVTMMITHHQGAVAMSKTELASGQYKGAKTLAQSIITSQTAQIGKLETLHKQLA